MSQSICGRPPWGGEGERELNLLPNFQKGGLDKPGFGFSLKDKLKYEIFNDKKKFIRKFIFLRHH